MKKLTGFVLVLALCLSLFAGCADTGKDTEVKYVDNYKTSFTSVTASFNPFTIPDASRLTWVANIMDGLIETDIYARYAPALAESWESSDDLTVWTFKIRQGQYFVDHTGAKTEYEITAQSWVESLRYVADPMNDANYLSIVRNVIDGLADYYWALSDIDDGTDTDTNREDVLATFEEVVGVKAVDKYTLQYTLSGPTPYFLSFLLMEIFVPIAPEFVAAKGEDFGTSKENLLYCGGYYMSQWDRDKMIILTKNDHYWDKDKINLKQLQFEMVSDSVSTVEMFQRGEIHDTTLTSEQLAAVRGGDFGKYVYLSEKSPLTYWFYFNFVGPDGPYPYNPEFNLACNNENFRKAIYYAINRNTLSAIWEPNDPEFFVRTTLLPENVMFDENVKDYTDYPALKPYKDNPAAQFDVDKAKEYLAAAIAEMTEADGVTLKGVTPGKVSRLPITEFDIDGKLPIDILYTSSNTDSEMKKSLLVKEMLESYLGKENVNIILGYSNTSFSSEVWALGNWDLVDDNFGFRYADPSTNLNRLTSDYDLNDCLYDIPEYDAMVEDALTTYDIEERYTKYSEAEVWLMEHAYYIPYLSGGGSYQMTHIVPYTQPQGTFGMARYKYKGALIQETPVTTEQHAQLAEAYTKAIAALAN